MTIANMKTSMPVFLLALLLHQSLSAPPQIAWSALDLAAISRMTPQELEILAEGLAAEEIIRSKRSSNVVGQIASKVSSGLTSKLGLIGQASAGASSFISGASSGSKGEEHGYSYGPDNSSHAEKPVDFWTLKKSILNTLFQAVKAITGGVTILKGQLIKGGGALASAAGRLIAGKGDTVTNLGRKIVNSAQLSPPKHGHASPAHYAAPPHAEFVPPSAYGAPSAPAHYGPPPTASAHYGAPPSAPSHYAHSAPSAPAKYTSNYEGHGKQLTGLHAGLILLKPLDNDVHHNGDSHTAPSGPGHEQAHLEHAPEPSKLSIINSAFQALKGVIGSVSPLSAHQVPGPVDHSHSNSADSYGLTGPEHNSIHVPPPPPPPYTSYGVPAFKPMESFHAEMSHDQLNSYGAPAEDYSASFPPSSPPAHSNALYPPLGPLYNINKVIDNVDKVTSLDRSSENIPLFSAMDLYQQMLLKNSQTTTSKPVTTTVVFPSKNQNHQSQDIQNIIEPRSKSNESSPFESLKRQSDKRKRSSEGSLGTKSSVEASRAIRYVLRGNRIVAV